MDIQDPPELGSALIRWINSFEFVTQPVKSWRALQDGKLLWKILQDVEPQYFEGELPEPDTGASDNWIPRWQNLKHINRLVISFISEECGKLQELSKKMTPDLKSIAIDVSSKDSQRLATEVLLAALYSPESNQRMIMVMDQLGTKTGIAIATCISQMEALDHKLAESALAVPDVDSDVGERMSSPEPDGRQASARRRDPELEKEEQLINAYSQIQNLERNNAAVTQDLEQSRQDAKELQDELTEVRYKLEHGHTEEVEEGVLEQLKQKANFDRDSIAQLETELADARAEVESQQKQLDKLSQESETNQKLKDELQLLKVERDDLRQKSKANENLKKKIQTLQDSDKSNQTLRNDFAAAEQELKSLRPLKNKVTALQKANEENMKTIQNVEQEIFDQKTTKKRLDHELKMVNRQYESAKEKHSRDAEAIREQEEKIRELESCGDGEGTNVESLDDEFVSTDKSRNDLKKKNNELENELTKLRERLENASISNGKVNGEQEEREEEDQEESSVSQSAYSLLKSRCETLEKKYLEVYQENLGLTSSISTQEEIDAESRPFVEAREKLQSESSQRQLAEKRNFELQTELAEIKLHLSSAQTKLGAVDKDKQNALKDLQHTAAGDNEILHTENMRLLQYVRTFESDLEEHRSLLRHALLDQTALVKAEKDKRFEQEEKLITEQLRAVIDDPARTSDMALRLTQRIEEARELASQTQKDQEEMPSEQREELEDEIETLKRRLVEAEEKAKVMSDGGEEGKQTKRELRLMTTAWYDLARRLQSDAVVVSRRSEAPRGFLGRQRKMMEGVPVRR